MFLNFKMIYQLGYAASNEKLGRYYSYRRKSLRPIPLSHSGSYMEGLWTSRQAEAENTVVISTEGAKSPCAHVQERCCTSGSGKVPFIKHYGWHT